MVGNRSLRITTTLKRCWSPELPVPKWGSDRCTCHPSQDTGDSKCRIPCGNKYHSRCGSTCRDTSSFQCLENKYAQTDNYWNGYPYCYNESHTNNSAWSGNTSWSNCNLPDGGCSYIQPDEGCTDRDCSSPFPTAESHSCQPWCTQASCYADANLDRCGCDVHAWQRCRPNECS